MAKSRRPTGTTLDVTADELDDRRRSLRVATRSSIDVARLVQQHVAQLLARHRLAVDLDPIAWLDDGVELAAASVDDARARP